MTDALGRDIRDHAVLISDQPRPDALGINRRMLQLRNRLSHWLGSDDFALIKRLDSESALRGAEILIYRRR